MTREERDSVPYAVDPFGPTANPAAYVPNEATERVREAMLAALDLNRSTAVVGPPGHGKTLLLHLIGDRQKERSRVAYVPYSSLGVEEFFAMVLDGLGSRIDLPPEQALPVLVGELGPRGGVTLLIDDAHSMQLDTAKVLARMQRAAHGDLRLVFAALDGDAAFRVLQAFGDHVEVLSLHGSLSEAEARSYIECRLAHAGARPELVSVFDDDKVAELHQASQGVPRRLNQAAQELVRRTAPGSMPQLRDLTTKPVPEETDEREVSLASLAERVLSGENAFSRRQPAEPPPAPTPAPIEEVAPRFDPVPQREAPVRGPDRAEPAPSADVQIEVAADEAVTRPEVEAGPATVTRPEVEAGPATVTRPEVEAGPATVTRPEVEAGPATVTRPEIEAPRATGRSSTILEADPIAADPAPSHRPPEPLPERPAPPRNVRPSPRSRPAPTEGAYRMARDPEASAARRAQAAAEFTAPPVRQQSVDPTPAPGFEGIEPRNSVWSRQTAISISRWLSFAAGVGIAVMWWAGRDAGVDREPGRGVTSANEVMERLREAREAREPGAAEPSAEATAPSVADVDARPPARVEPLPLQRPRVDPFARPRGLRPEDSTAGQAAAPVPPVEVSINATPWATIEIDGRYIGETPLAGVPVAPGPHEFRATLPDGSVRVQTLEISEDLRAISFR